MTAYKMMFAVQMVGTGATELQILRSHHQMSSTGRCGSLCLSILHEAYEPLGIIEPLGRTAGPNVEQ
jgi:hypothetical protein